MREVSRIEFVDEMADAMEKSRKDAMKLLHVLYM